MRITTEVLTSEDIMKLLSKTERIHWCVYIHPDDVKGDPIRAISKMNLMCDDQDVTLGHMIMEIFDRKQEAIDRVMEFRGEWLEQFYVCCYKNGVFVNENT